MQIFSNWLKKKKLTSPVDVSSLVTDMHSHLIPGIDDGVPDVDTAIALIKELAGLGYRKVITTPHIMVDLYKNPPEIIRKGEKQVKEAIEAERINIEFEASAEYQLDEGFLNHFKNGQLMTFGGKYLLLELSYFNAPPNLFEMLFDLQLAGYKVILAHPERYAYWHRDFSKLEDLKNRNVFFQLNMISLSGFYSLPIKKISERLIDGGMVDFIGSDLHSHQYLNLIEKALYEPYLEKLINSGKLKNHLL